MYLELTKEDFKRPFTDPKTCPMSHALRRQGFSAVRCGTIEADVVYDQHKLTVWVSGVYLNGKKIDHPAAGFGPNEFSRIRQAFHQDENTVARIELINLN